MNKNENLILLADAPVIQPVPQLTWNLRQAPLLYAFHLVPGQLRKHWLLKSKTLFPVEGTAH